MPVQNGQSWRCFASSLGHILCNDDGSPPHTHAHILSSTQVVLQLKDTNSQLDALLVKLGGRSADMSAHVAAAHGGGVGVAGGGNGGGAGADAGSGGLLSPLAAIPPGSAMAGGLVGSLSFQASVPHVLHGQDRCRERGASAGLGQVMGGSSGGGGDGVGVIGASLLSGDASAMVAATLVNRAVEDAKLSIERWKATSVTIMDRVSDK